MPTDIPINGPIQWLFYIIGWLLGSLNPVFWIMLYMAYIVYDQEEKFINPMFHKRVYLFGIAMFILMITLYIIIEIFK